MSALINEKQFSDVFNPDLKIGDECRVCSSGHFLDWCHVELVGDKGATLLVKTGNIIAEVKRDQVIKINRV